MPARPLITLGMNLNKRSRTILLAVRSGTLNHHELDIAIAARSWGWLVARIPQYCPLLLDADLVRAGQFRRRPVGFECLRRVLARPEYFR